MTSNINQMVDFKILSICFYQREKNWGLLYCIVIAEEIVDLLQKKREGGLVFKVDFEN